jgi:hypothetical protein
MGCKAVIDTGTYFIYGAEALVDKLLEDVKGIDPCDEHAMPDFVISLLGFIYQIQ